MAARKGYTLLELMLVLALIITVAALTFPLADLLLNRNKITAAQDQIRGHLVKLRSIAMAKGRAYTFKVIENTGRFRIEPDAETELSADDDEPYVVEGQLEDVIFVKQTSVLVKGSTPPQGGQYETVVVFLPNGTCPNNALLIFGIPGEGARAIGIRGLTGAIQQADLLNGEGSP